MLASVIVPVYNASKWSSSMADSFKLNEENIGEIILINDGDEEDFRELVKNLRRRGVSDIKILHTEGQVGPGPARDLGISNASFSILAFLDCDDIWVEGGLRERLRCLEVESDASIVCSAFYKIIDGTEKRHYILPKNFFGVSDILVTNHICLPSVVIRKADLDGLKFGDIGHEDLEFWIELMLRTGKGGVCIGSPLCIVRATPGSVSSVRHRSAFWHWSIISKYNIPFLIRCAMFFVYALNAYLKRGLNVYKPFYLGLNRLLEVRWLFRRIESRIRNA